MDNKYIARPCKNCKVNDCCFKGHENNFEICEDYTTTNGDVLKAMFPNLKVEDNGGSIYLHYPDDGWIVFDRDFWNAPYKKEVE